jgi:hypothetical protein
MRNGLIPIIILLFVFSAGCIENDDREEEAGEIELPKDLVLDLLFHMNWGYYSQAISLLVNENGHFWTDTEVDLDKIEQRLIEVYGENGENV